MTGPNPPRAGSPARLPWLSRHLLWTEDRIKVRRLVWALAVLCTGLALADFFYHKHVYFEIEDIPGFYGIYGFIMCVAMAIAAKVLRVLVKRNEDYYAPYSVESEEHPEADLGRENTHA
ncbi:hypothetical protein [Parvibaculum sp.]|uniref:hypothetical protein n=1 Tax=Parvibaculum sp. TaxID=2024848 RepID=UPI0032992DF6